MVKFIRNDTTSGETMAVTIKDIAKETGLANATISAYLNGVPVREYNRVKIEQAIKKLGYIRNEYARGLKTHRSGTIGVLIPELSNVFSTTIITEIEERLRERGYGIIVCDCRTDIKREEEAIRFLLSKMVDGLIIMPVSTDKSEFTVALEKKIPVVVIDRKTDSEEVSHIVINNREISRTATDNILAKGCRKIALVTGDMSVYTAKERKIGYEEAMLAKGVYDENMVYNGGLSVEGGYSATKSILSSHPDVEAIFVTNYEMTMGSIIALNEEGRKIGEDIDFTGFDNVEITRAFFPDMETVNQPLTEIGRVAAQTMYDMINGEQPVNITLKAQIV